MNKYQFLQKNLARIEKSKLRIQAQIKKLDKLIVIVSELGKTQNH